MTIGDAVLWLKKIALTKKWSKKKWNTWRV